AELGRLPVYLMIRRTGNTFQAATSRDGRAYTLIPGSGLDLVVPVTSLAGLAASSSVNDQLGSAQFAQFSVSAPAGAPRSGSDGSACPAGWGCGDVGNPKLVGGQSLHDGAWTVSAAGTDIWGTSDQFHLVSQQITDDATISARVVGVPAGTPDAKSGLMFRTS